MASENDGGPIRISPSAAERAARDSKFPTLVESRRAWIEQTLRPWCREATRRDLLLAEAEWNDLGGTASPEDSLWTWAWSRFPVLVHEELGRIDESREILVRLKDDTQVRGFPDARSSERGHLVLLTTHTDGRSEESPPLSLDDVADIEIA